ncbi:hypothetical protein JNJ66_06565 [Candidatus Saccharibacteria bacterium]|nr:hypothetical protein [Candidatus Saccharibacteria bacterium]
MSEKRSANTHDFLAVRGFSREEQEEAVERVEAARGDMEYQYRELRELLDYVILASRWEARTALRPKAPVIEAFMIDTPMRVSADREGNAAMFGEKVVYVRETVEGDTDATEMETIQFIESVTGEDGALEHHLALQVMLLDGRVHIDDYRIEGSPVEDICDDADATAEVNVWLQEQFSHRTGMRWQPCPQTD